MQVLFILLFIFLTHTFSLAQPSHLYKKSLMFGSNFSYTSSSSFYDSEGKSATDRIKYFNLQSYASPDGSNNLMNVPLFYNYEFTKSTINIYSSYPITQNWFVGISLDYSFYSIEDKQKLTLFNSNGTQLTQEFPTRNLDDSRFDYLNFSTTYIVLDSVHHLWLDFLFNQALGDYNSPSKAGDIFQRRPMILKSKISYGYDFGDNFISASSYYQYQDSYFRDLLGFAFRFESSKVEDTKLIIELDYKFPINGRIDAIEYHPFVSSKVMGKTSGANFYSMDFLPYRYNIQETSLNFRGRFDLRMFEDYIMSIGYSRTAWGIDLAEEGQISFGLMYLY